MQAKYLSSTPSISRNFGGDCGARIRVFCFSGKCYSVSAKSPWAIQYLTHAVARTTRRGCVRYPRCCPWRKNWRRALASNQTPQCECPRFSKPRRTAESASLSIIARPSIGHPWRSPSASPSRALCFNFQRTTTRAPSGSETWGD